MRTTELKLATVELECLVGEGQSSYFIDGRVQRRGDKGRLPACDAAWPVKQGKARIVPGSEEIVSQSQTALLNFPGSWSATKW